MKHGEPAVGMVAGHYRSLLSPIYVWMCGGIDAALATGAADVGEFVPGSGLAVDLGAGFGMHAIPLARAGYQVLAIDSSPELLGALRDGAVGLPVRMVGANLLDFTRYLDGEAALILCLGDTLTHLDQVAEVEQLFRDVSRSLRVGGRFVLTFRNYSHLPGGNDRFISVRGDENRILTCFLEEQPEHVLVHDMLHEREGSTWRMRVGSYRKLRLPPAQVATMLSRCGLEPAIGPGSRGMVRIVARRRSTRSGGARLPAAIRRNA